MFFFDTAHEVLEQTLLLDETDGSEVNTALLVSKIELLCTEGKWKEAKPCCEEALAKQRRVHGESHSLVAEAKMLLGRILSELGDQKQARRMWSRPPLIMSHPAKYSS